LFEGGIAVRAGRVLGTAAALRLPKAALAPVVKAYVAWFDVEMTDVLVPRGGFETFGEFFARKMKPGARPVCGDPGSVISPCDGVVIEAGRIDDGAASALTVKGTVYRLDELVADRGIAAGLAGGGYCLIYLHPRDYHRVHSPLDATLKEVRRVPGARYPVASWAEKLGVAVLGKNERVAFDLELPDDDRRLSLLMVAAFGVSDIECRGTGSLRRGDEVGAFRLGSTVGLFWPRGLVALDDTIEAGSRVLMGQRIGRAMSFPRV
jgi:phosphatidylserine decarboxylase